MTSERGQKRPDPENFVKSTADLDSNKLSLCSPIRPATLPSSSQRCNCYSRRLSCFIRADQRLAACPVDSEPASSRNPPDCTGDRKTVSRPVSSEQLSPATDRKATDQRYEAAFLPLPFCSSSRAVILSLPPISRCTPPPPQIASILSWFWPGCLAAWPPLGSRPACDAEPCPPLQPISPSIIQTQCNECLPTSRSATVNNTSGARLRSHLPTFPVSTSRPLGCASLVANFQPVTGRAHRKPRPRHETANHIPDPRNQGHRNSSTWRPITIASIDHCLTIGPRQSRDSHCLRRTINEIDPRAPSTPSTVASITRRAPAHLALPSSAISP